MAICIHSVFVSVLESLDMALRIILQGVFVSNLYKDAAVKNSDCITSGDWVIVSNEFGRMSKEALFAQCTKPLVRIVDVLAKI
jgi:hypothetical protein